MARVAVVDRPASDEELAKLRQALAWTGPQDEEDARALSLLLDDELERLDAAGRARLRGRASGALGKAVLACTGCDALVLPRFRSADGRCRACGALLEGAASAGATTRPDRPAAPPGSAPAAGAPATRAATGAPAGEPLALTPLADLPPAWTLADRLAPGRKLELGADNEDWDERLEREVAERARREAEERERLGAEERRRREAEEKARREEEERKRREDEERLRREEEERKRREEEERLRREAEEAARLAAEKARPALGCLIGARVGTIVRLEDEPAGEPSGVWLAADGSVIARVARAGGAAILVNDKPVTGTTPVALGDTVVWGDEAFAVEETGELGVMVAPTIHLARNDGQPGGPWPYWNEEVRLGAGADCEVKVVDDGVDDVHARVATRYGRVLLTDACKTEDGVWVGGKRRPWVVVTAGLAFKLGSSGAELVVNAGEANLKPTGEAAAMKPSRHTRTLLEVKDAAGTVVRKVFVFARRELRFGSKSKTKDEKSLNELTLIPSAADEAAIADKQGGLELTRNGVDLRRDGGAPMLLDETPLEPGKPQALKRSFLVQVGDGMHLQGRAYRSPSGIERTSGPAALGIKGGHPYECVRIERLGTTHVYVFLVRMLRIGSEAGAPLRIELPGVAEGHAQIQLSGGKFQIVAPKAGAPVKLNDIQLDPAVPYPLEINTDVKLGEATLRFREVDEGDFLP